MLGNHKKEYIPIFALNQRAIPEITEQLRGNYNTYIYNFLKRPGENKPFKNLALNKIFDLNIDSHDNRGVQSLEELKVLSEIFPPAIDDYVNRKEDFDIGTSQRGDSYDSLFLALSENNWGEIKIKSSGYLTNLGACFQTTKSNTGKIVTIKPIFVLVTKPEFVKYLRLCWLTGRNPDPSIFEMWMDPEFVSKGTNYKYLRINFRHKLKPWLETNKINIIPVPDMFDRLFYSIKMPNDIKTIKERKGWIEGNTKEVLEHLKIQKKLESKGIKLSL